MQYNINDGISPAKCIYVFSSTVNIIVSEAIFLVCSMAQIIYIYIYICFRPYVVPSMF